MDVKEYFWADSKIVLGYINDEDFWTFLTEVECIIKKPNLLLPPPARSIRNGSIRERALKAGAAFVRSILEAMAKEISSPAEIAYEVGRPDKEHERRRGHYQRQCLRTSQPMEVGPN